MKIYQFYLVMSVVNASKKKIVKHQAEKYKCIFMHYIVARIREEDITEIKTSLQLGDSFISEISKHN